MRTCVFVYTFAAIIPCVCICVYACVYVFVCELISISIWTLKWTCAVLFVCVLFCFCSVDNKVSSTATISATGIYLVWKKSKVKKWNPHRPTAPSYRARVRITFSIYSRNSNDQRWCNYLHAYNNNNHNICSNSDGNIDNNNNKKKTRKSKALVNR